MVVSVLLVYSGPRDVYSAPLVKILFKEGGELKMVAEIFYEPTFQKGALWIRSLNGRYEFTIINDVVGTIVKLLENATWAIFAEVFVEDGALYERLKNILLSRRIKVSAAWKPPME